MSSPELTDVEKRAEKERLKREQQERLAAIMADPRAIELFEQLRTATPQGISQYVDQQATDAASVRTMLKRIILVLSVLVGESSI